MTEEDAKQILIFLKDHKEEQYSISELVKFTKMSETRVNLATRKLKKYGEIIRAAFLNSKSIVQYKVY